MLARPVNAKEILASLRAEGAVEYGICGFDEIGQWFYKIGFSPRPPQRRTLMRWKQQAGLPYGRPRVRESKAWTTNLLLMAWAAARFHRAQAKPLSRRSQYRRQAQSRIRQEDIDAVNEAIRRKLLSGSAPSETPREGQGTRPKEPPSS